MSPRESRSFEAAAASVPAARRFARTTLDGWVTAGSEESADAVDLAVLLVSEVATNALLHARSSFEVTLVLEGPLLRVAISDSSPVLPQRRHHTDTATTGRGVGLVADLARAWGVEQLDAGKCIWFELDLPGARSGRPGARGTLAG